MNGKRRRGGEIIDGNELGTLLLCTWKALEGGKEWIRMCYVFLTGSRRHCLCMRLLRKNFFLDRQIARYQKWKFGLWAVILKETDEMIGQCGLTMQPWKGDEVLEIGYLFERSHWHNGYAAEAAKACRQYAFETLNAAEVCSIIRDTNIASQNVAIRNGMTMTDTWIKHYRGVDMPHYRYVVCR